MKSILVTGAAGFIGAFLCKRLLEAGNCAVVGFDNLNDYYSVKLKEERLALLCEVGGESFSFVKGDLIDEAALAAVFEKHHPDIVVNLAAQAGVRYSIDHPRAFVDSNVVGFLNVLEACRNYPVEHLVFASSSSVYGIDEHVPYSTDDKADAPVSLYAATKRSDELMAHAYAKLFGIPCTGLRFFTVYGPMGRPDMAYYKFADKIARGEPIQVYNEGDMWRDFTYIDDIVSGVVAVMEKPPAETPIGAPYRVYNIGNSRPESLMNFIDILERLLVEEGVADAPAIRELLPMQPGDVYQTYADVADLERDTGFKPSTPLEDGLREFVLWYKGYTERG